QSKRQIGLLANRRGEIVYVIIGDHGRIVIPDLKRYRVSVERLRGLRLLHTHLKNEPLSEEDLTDMMLLRLDCVAVVQSNEHGMPTVMEMATINPAAGAPLAHTAPMERFRSLKRRGTQALQPWRNGVEPPYLIQRHAMLLPQPNFQEMIAALEEELTRAGA